MDKIIQEIGAKLGYEFKQIQLLKMALTHRSKGIEHNERLEYLGDAIINFVIAEILFQKFPKATEGELSRWRASLVNRETLTNLAKKFDLGQYLFLGPGELRSGGNERHSILSCAMEAIIGAIYLDGGMTVTTACITKWYQEWIESLSAASHHKDPKTLLQEYLQSNRLALPIYKVEAIAGEAHQQQFTISCQIEELQLKSEGCGTSRRRAEQAAASAMLQLIKRVKV